MILQGVCRCSVCMSLHATADKKSKYALFPRAWGPGLQMTGVL